MRIIRINQSNIDEPEIDEKLRMSPVPHIPLTEKGGWEEGKKREEIICNAIRKMAEEWGVGPIREPLRIDARGDITMIQGMKGENNYINPKAINPDLVEIAVKYAGYAVGEIGHNRWIKLNHFAWEKMLSGMGLLPRRTIDEEEFLKDIGK